MDTLHLTAKPDSDTAATKPGKTGRDRQPAGKVDKAPTAKRDRKAAPVTKDVPVTVTDTETAAQEATVTAKDPEPTTQEPSVSDSTPEVNAPTVTEPKKPTKADLAQEIFDDMVKDPNVSRQDIIGRLRKDAGLTTSGAQSYYYKFRKESGRVVEKGPTKMDQAREVFQALTTEGKARKEIIAALIKDVGLTKAGASNLLSSAQEERRKAYRVSSTTDRETLLGGLPAPSFWVSVTFVYRRNITRYKRFGLTTLSEIITPSVQIRYTPLESR